MPTIHSLSHYNFIGCRIRFLDLYKKSLSVQIFAKGGVGKKIGFKCRKKQNNPPTSSKLLKNISYKIKFNNVFFFFLISKSEKFK